MIRVRKSYTIPASLLVPHPVFYDGQDVQERLFEDQDGKCYLCEQETGKDFQIEHLRPKAPGYYPELKFEWTNLFLVCPYCNGRKPNSLTQIHSPYQTDIEILIRQELSFSNNKIELMGDEENNSTKETIRLLNKLFNGNNGLRDKKCQILFNEVKEEIIFFYNCLNQYRDEPSDENKQIVIDCLNIKKEFLGIKFWTINENQDLFNTFRQYMNWNRIER
jgi:uncharacterized protein (TIGR02646 family)